MCLLRMNLPNLCPNMIHFGALEFSEWHSEEVISFFWRSVYNIIKACPGFIVAINGHFLFQMPKRNNTWLKPTDIKIQAHLCSANRLWTYLFRTVNIHYSLNKKICRMMVVCFYCIMCACQLNRWTCIYTCTHPSNTSHILVIFLLSKQKFTSCFGFTQ